jgi:hypothetical protein
MGRERIVAKKDKADTPSEKSDNAKATQASLAEATELNAPPNPTETPTPTVKPGPTETAGSGGGVKSSHDPDTRQLAFFAAGLGLVAVIAALTGPIWAPRFYDDPLRAQITSASQMLERVSKAVGELEAVVPGLDSASGEIEARLAAIEASIERVKLPAFLLAIGELRKGMRGSNPFETELEVAVSVTGGDAELDAQFANVSEMARNGVPTTRQLNRRFGAIAQSMFLASQIPPNANVTSRALARLSAVAVQVRVKFMGERPGNDVAAVISRIQARIDEGSLGKAIGELKSLPEASQMVAAEWIADAEKRIQVNEVHNFFKTMMMKRAVIGNKS